MGKWHGNRQGGRHVGYDVITDYQACPNGQVSWSKFIAAYQAYVTSTT
jgi:hypothetical protein